ncbi:MAG: exodeoxyribonuclease VII large subunit [Actinomycetota bacterium]|nr:exodeoxyribonuclease VII large subunit [Actinomycetota bacterium]
MSLFEDPNVGVAPEPTFTVTELSDRIGNAVRAAFRDEVWVRGEIRDLSRPQSGHVYFTLTEAGEGGGACLQVMLSARNKPSVNAILKLAGGAVRMNDGTDVRIRGRLDWYPQRGVLQLRMTSIDPTYTLGALEAARLELLQRLTAEGLLTANGERPWPLLPLTVGLVTSEGSAAAADFLHELSGSGFAFRVLHADTRVQGLEAPRSIATAIERLATHRPDVIALVRGGGARTDLAAFDHEVVARAIAVCPVPVVTGIGHEIDQSIADDVAHTSAKTPTACAALLVDAVADASIRAETAWASVARVATRELADHDQRVRTHGSALAREARAVLQGREARMTTIGASLAREARAVLHGRETRLGTIADRTRRSARAGVSSAARFTRAASTSTSTASSSISSRIVSSSASASA